MNDLPGIPPAEGTIAVSISSVRQATRLVEGLSSEGLDVVNVTGIDGIADVVAPSGVAVAIVDDADTEWLRHVADMLSVRPNVMPLAFIDVGSRAELLAAISAGVDGFVSPTADIAAVVRTIRELFARGASVPRGFVPVLIDEVRRGRGRSVATASGPIDVTDREWEILQLMLQRRSTREIAELLFVSVGTVRSHISALGRKLGARDRADTIRLLEQGGGRRRR